MRDSFVDGLLEERLRDDPEFRRAHHLDARFHSDVALLRAAAARVHSALVATGEANAEDIIRVMLNGFPDTRAALDRIAEHERRTWSPLYR